MKDNERPLATGARDFILSRKTGLIIALLMLTAACSRDRKAVEAAAPKAPEPIAVRTAPAEARVIDRTIAVTGSLNPDETVTVSSEVDGRVSRVLVDFGQQVRQGRVVVELDKQELALQLQRAQSALAQAQARLGMDASASGSATTAAMRQMQAQMEDARSRYENAKKLVASGDISQERFVELEKAYRARVAAYEGARDEQNTQVAGLDGLRAELALARKRLNDATVRAPFSGTVSQKLVAPGQYTKANTAMLTIVKTNPMRLLVDIPETATGNVRVGTMLTFATDAAPGARYNAVIRQLNPALDPKSRSLTAEARLTSNDARLRPGMFVQVELVLAKSTEVVAVPKQAIYNVAGLNKMFVIRNGKAMEAKITPGQDLGTWIEVPREAVNPGEQVAVSGLARLVNGVPVSATAANTKG
ncbi:MAG TPA: efflux RND transporter periplasmic adaptor subunit [Bryobacteraceae bacterium]|nr:efflux RND transporter periplasmic adaptor subunit [Bryobacteraceae bacterium]